ncbi:MAG: ATP-binding protein [Balneolaceae bacterium]
MTPKRKLNLDNRIFLLALRISLPPGFGLFLILLLLLTIFSEMPFLTVLGLSLAVSLLAMLFIYLSARRILFDRLEMINRIVKNIARKSFEEYSYLNTGHQDELDYLVVRAARTSKVIEREILRLNKIENYRKEFIGDISHELKTPIFAVQGFIETLLNGALEDEKVNRLFLKKAMKNVTRLTYLTKDLMEISKLETGELKSDIQVVNLRSVILDVSENLQYKSQNEKVEIRIGEIDKNIWVRADRNQIKQVLFNLIENGMKYNRPYGYVEIGVKPYPRKSGKLLVSVRDTGIGIEPADIRRVTERFFRVDKSRSREKGGTGLGLSIVKHILEAHGEELFIESSVNKGSTFSFTLTRFEGEGSFRKETEKETT